MLILIILLPMQFLVITCRFLQPCTSIQPRTNSYTRPTVVHPGESATGLAVSHLASIADKLIGNSLAASSRKTYSSAQAKYFNFCSRMCLAPIPASQQQLILFAADLSQTVTNATMRTYLSAVTKATEAFVKCRGHWYKHSMCQQLKLGVWKETLYACADDDPVPYIINY